MALNRSFTIYRLSYKHRLEIKVQFTGTKLMYRLSYKYWLCNLQVSRLGNL